MQSGDFNAISAARFQVWTESKIGVIEHTLELLWQHNAKRRAEIEAISTRINGAILWAAMGAAALLFSVIKPKLGL